MEDRHETLYRLFMECAAYGEEPDWRAFANVVILREQRKNPGLKLEKITPNE